MACGRAGWADVRSLFLTWRWKPTLPFKLNHDRRRPIPRQKHRIINSAAYDAALRQRGSLTVWFTDAAIEDWRAAPRTTPGGQPWYFPLAILIAITLKAVFRLALRPDRGPDRLRRRPARAGLCVPDHSTLIHRAKTMVMPRPQLRRSGEALHLLVDSTGLRRCGAGK